MHEDGSSLVFHFLCTSSSRGIDCVILLLPDGTTTPVEANVYLNINNECAVSLV